MLRNHFEPSLSLKTFHVNEHVFFLYVHDDVVYFSVVVFGVLNQAMVY